MDPFRNLVGVGGAGCSEVTLDPSRVQQAEFETAKMFAEVIWGAEGLAACLGPSWYLVHDPRFLAIERIWAREDKGMLGGVVRRGVSLVDALDLQSKIRIIEDPELYSEMLAEGRHFRDVAIKRGYDPQDLHLFPEQIQSLLLSECPNYIRRNGEWNDEAESLRAMLVAGLVALIDDYAEMAYSRDWIRMDTGEVVHKGEVIWDGVSGVQVPIVAVEVDTLHKALIMRAQVRTTALRLLQSFPGLKSLDIDTLVLTDNESDRFAQILFSTDYDKLYLVLPEIEELIRIAKTFPLELRVASELKALSNEAHAFHAKLTSGEILPIITPIEEDPNAAVDPGAFLGALQATPYLREVFTALQNLGERGDDHARALTDAITTSGGTDKAFHDAEDWLLTEGKHPKQHVYEGRLLLTPWQEHDLRSDLGSLLVEDPQSGEDRSLTLAEVDKAVVARTYGHTSDPMALGLAVVRRGVDASGPLLAQLASDIYRTDSTAAPAVTTVEETFDGSLEKNQ